MLSTFLSLFARVVTPAALSMLCLASATARADALLLDTIRLSPGFHIELLTGAVPGAREMALSPRGTLFVGSRGEGKVYAVTLSGKHAQSVRTIAQGLNMPVGVAFRDGALYVSAVSRILRFDNVEAQLDHPPPPKVIYNRLPTETHHGWKFIAFGPDGYLYVPVGAPCNVCLRDEDRYAMIGRMKPDGGDWQVFARGVRNTVGFDWQPGTGILWFTDNGRDMMGDDVPDDKLNRAPQPGLHFGFPYCHGGDTPDPEFGRRQTCGKFTPPAARLGAHVAALGMRFYTGKAFPPEYRNNIFIAEHGSWNRSKKVGYRVVRVVLDENGQVVRHEVFAEGWLQPGEKVWGRPVDVLVMPDGALLVSDDYAGAIYRISYRAP